MYSDVTCAILVGGKSKRMKTNKAFLKINGKFIIERTCELMQREFSKVVLISNSPEEYKFLKLNIYEDIFKWKGPLAGIHSALTYSSTEKVFIISCDMPLMTKEMIKYLVDFKTDKPITIARADGFVQQLCGVYNKSVLSIAEKILMSDNSINLKEKCGCKVLQLINETSAEIVEAEILPFYKKNTYINMNKTEDYEFVISYLNEIQLG